MFKYKGRKAVLRKKPPGKKGLLKGAHAIDREFRIQQALFKQGFPVPKQFHYCKDPEVIGAEFYIMEYVEGRIFLDQNLPGMTPDERRVIYDEMMKVLAMLHKFNPMAIGLEGYGKADNSYFQRQI